MPLFAPCCTLHSLWAIRLYVIMAYISHQAVMMLPLRAPRYDKGIFPVSLFRFHQKWFLLRILWETLKLQIPEPCPERLTQ